VPDPLTLEDVALARAAGRVLARSEEREGPLDTPCWVWTGTHSHDGYGQVKATGAMRYVHVVVYRALVGPIPEGLELDHLCRVRDCSNPAHLEPVTHKENHARGMKAQQTECIHGHAFTAANTLRKSNGRRACRICENEGRRRRRRERIAA